MEKTKKTFDAVALMRRLRDEMSAEIEGMSYEEQKRYLSDRIRPEPENALEEETEQPLTK